MKEIGTLRSGLSFEINHIICNEFFWRYFQLVSVMTARADMDRAGIVRAGTVRTGMDRTETDRAGSGRAA